MYVSENSIISVDRHVPRHKGKSDGSQDALRGVQKYFKLMLYGVAFKKCMKCCRRKLTIWPGKYFHEETPQTCADLSRNYICRDFRALSGVIYY